MKLECGNWKWELKIGYTEKIGNQLPYPRFNNIREMLPFQRLELPVSLLEEVIEQARGELPNECCGLLAGSVIDGVGVVSTRFPIGNDGSSPREYLSNPRDMLLAFRSMRERGLELLAIYHSHPRSDPVPSQRDIERNTYGESVVHLIVGLVDSQPVTRVWWLGERDYREAEWSLIQ